MRILCVDDEPLMLQMLEMAVKEAKPDADITAFDDQDELLMLLQQPRYRDVFQPGVIKVKLPPPRR